MRFVISALLLLLLCAATGCLVKAEHRCMFDQIVKDAENVPVTIVPELPRRGAEGWEAYTVSQSGWDPLRITVSTEDLRRVSRFCFAENQMRPNFLGGSVVCTAADILTHAKRRVLINNLIPAALKLHTDRLLVNPITKRFRVPILTGDICRSFSVPSSHRRIGVTNADFVLYVAAGPIRNGALAWATSCGSLTNGRPAIGVMNVPSSSIADTYFAIRSVAHEVAHALGFSASVFTTRNMVTIEPNIRGHSRHVVSSNMTLRKAMTHYNCSTIRGMELENEGGSGTALSHWERRNAKDELMSGMDGSAAYYSALTMAAFEDQGYYKAVWGMEEAMSWGNNSGCALLTDKCMENGVTRYPEMFCTTVETADVCTSDLLGLGTCSTMEHATNLSAMHQYFTSPTRGGYADSLTDYCPVVQSFFSTGCRDGETAFMPGSLVGPNSMCLKGDALRLRGRRALAVIDICAEVSCDDGVVRVRYSGDNAWHLCPEGERIEPKGSFRGGRIICPRHIDACPAPLAPISDASDSSAESLSSSSGSG